MSRKTKEVKINTGNAADNRDFGKCFWLTEMPAKRAEAWADRALITLSPLSDDTPPGMSGLAATLRYVRTIKFTELEPLMDELLNNCVQVFSPEMERDGDGVPKVMRRLNNNGDVNDDIEEVSTRQYLRAEVMSLHTNFSLAAVILGLIAVASTMTQLPIETTSDTSTSRRRSRRSSQQA